MLKGRELLFRTTQQCSGQKTENEFSLIAIVCSEELSLPSDQGLRLIGHRQDSLETRI